MSSHPGVTTTAWTIALATACGLACARVPAAPAASEDVVALLAGAPASTREWRIEARVADVAPSGRSGTRWLVDALSVDDPEPRALGGRIQLYVRMHAATISAGSRIRFRAKLRRIAPFGNPGELDWVGWNARRGAFVSAFVWDGREVEVLATAPSTPLERVGALRARVTLAAASAARGRAGALLAALVTGERTLLGEADARAVTASGLAHVLAISGLNLSLVGGGVFWLVHRALLETRLPRAGVDIARAAALAAVVATLAYTAISGGGVSVARASLMAVVAGGAVWQGRRGTGGAALAAAALAISLAMPGVAREVGFQLSFVAVVAILAYGAALRRRRRRPSAARSAIELSFLCWAVSTPIVAQHFGRVAVYGAPATLVTAPLATAIVATGLSGATAVAAGFAGVAEAFFRAGAVAAEGLLRAAHMFAALPAAELRVVAPGPLAAAAATLAPFSLLLEGRGRAAAITASTGILALSTLFAVHERYRADALDVHFLSVGQGDSTVLRLPGGRIAVVDAGLPGRGAMVVAPFLRRTQIRRVDYLVATHAQDDHAGGILELLEDVEVGELWTSASPCDVESFLRLREEAQARGTAIVDVGAGELPVRGGEGWRLSALWPREVGGSCDDNDRSVVIEVEFAGRRVLLGGDIEARAEAALLGAVGPARLDADVLSAPHHGSRTSSSLPFVAATSPAVVVASAGQGNRYGFPRSETRERYLAAGARFLTTATDGAVHVRIDAYGDLDVRTTLR
jgi:competence protein ComEC